ncbi:hypothetical protein [Aliiglaciecola sp. M165]|uniref:hypothetical protein n=1 Tax=Aliiglaciecola sp. M165 TaxID=2593649 RepID=UPI00117E578B|nr:hypothetical protein [Aliiglaciecola sp. M165]TRY33058.1 hypothetical protein FM019_03480 [Aliiglaciecola sp. M165]
MSEFLLAMDSGTSPLVGHQVMLNSNIQADESLLINAAEAGRIELIAFVYAEINLMSFKYQPGDQLWQPNSGQEQAISLDSLRQQATNASVLLMGVYPGTARRLALDYDQDDWMNRSQ